MTTVLIMAGGTGGHVFPALAVADVLKSRACRVVWLGTERGIEARLVPAAGIPVEWVRVSGLRGKGLASWLAAPLRLLQALADALGAIRRTRPDVVLGLGGFVAGPGGLAARLLNRPLVIHEQNTVAGLTNRILARFAGTVAEAFPGSFAPGVGAVAVGNPVRPAIEALSAGEGERAPHAPRRLLVFGGSQGAAALNRLVPAALALLAPGERPAVLHQTGRGRREPVAAAYAAHGVAAEVREFIDDMAAAYAWADLAVSRSGALTVAELAAAGLPGLLVPFPAAVDDHQTRNARFLADRGAAVLLAEEGLTAERLAAELKTLLGADARALAAMAAAARRAATPGAAEQLADLCLAAAGAAA
ncbi:MAG TPA: undecaprenyldiphospho-muramoylpentapeptide beta-N-acetylglucosaminyltransferase [Steroidobacteraceae bacterium]|nr:undecaprenyldiphospho-muramoylpentapeptide beta-N-acetylglucosaminyltransferase [Steroidobacteraceae bacterium]